VKRFQDVGEIIYNLKLAFVNYEFVIFEEIWDAFPEILLILKDILQSKEVRIGTQRFPLKCKIVIACTNRSAEEVISDDSTEALMQRFMFQEEVGWSSHNASDYMGAFKCALGTEEETTNMIGVAKIAAMCSVNNSANDKPLISPRTAGKALKAVNINGLFALKYMYGFDTSVVNRVQNEITSIEKDNKQIVSLYNLFKYISILTKELKSKAETFKGSPLRMIQLLCFLNDRRADYFETGIRDANIEEVRGLNSTLHLLMVDARRALSNYLAKTKPKEGTFAYTVHLKMSVDSNNFPSSLFEYRNWLDGHVQDINNCLGIKGITVNI